MCPHKILMASNMNEEDMMKTIMIINIHRATPNSTEIKENKCETMVLYIGSMRSRNIQL